MRKSRETDGPAHRLEAQREQLPAHARAQGWQPVVYDEGYASAAQGCRLPQRDRLERDLRAGRVQVVLCCELSRLSRDATLQDYVGWLALCSQHGVRLATPTRTLDPAQPSDWMLLLLEGGFSSVEMRVLQARMAEGRERAYEAGAWTGGPPPRGYRLDRGVPVVVPEEAAQVVALLEQVASGQPLWQVARAAGVPYQTLYTLTHDRLDHLQARRPSRARPGEWVTCAWEPIVPAALADRVRAAHHRRRRGPASNRPAHLLTGGLLVCAYCGHPYTSAYAGRRRADGSPVIYYDCSSRRSTNRRRCPRARMVQTHVADDAVGRHVIGQLARIDDLAGYYQATQPADAAEALRALEQRQAIHEGQRERLVQAIALGVLTPAEAAGRLDAARADLARVAAERAELLAAQADEPDWGALQVTPDTWAALLLDERRDLLAALLHRVRAYAGYLVLEYKIPLDRAGRTEARVRCTASTTPKNRG